jgi:hypothetical protein
MDTELLYIAGEMARRLRIFQRMRLDAEDCERDFISLSPRELFEPEDAKALELFDLYVRRRSGERPLFEEV